MDSVTNSQPFATTFSESVVNHRTFRSTMSGKANAEEKLELMNWVMQASPQALSHMRKSMEEYERQVRAKTAVVGYRSRGQAVDWAQFEANISEAILSIEEGRGRSLEIIEHESDTW